MVVTCPKCSTSYEFDDTLVGSKGTVVRCTQCSHMFKIFADESDDSIEHAGWMIRKASGKVFGIDKFSTIQKWVREGKISAHDSLSRTGKSWKKLGDIVELQAMFAVAESNKAALKPTPAAGGPPVPARLSLQAEESHSGLEEVRPDGPTVRRAPPGAERSEPRIRYKAEPEPGTVKGPLARSLEASVEPGEEKEDRLLMPDYKPGRWKLWLVLGILVVVAGVGVAGYLRRDIVIGWVTGLSAPATEGERDRSLERAHEYFLLDTGSYFDQAEKILRELIEEDEGDAAAKASLAELLAAKAQYARDRREIFGLEGDEDSGTLAREAKKLAQLAVLASPDSLEANRALADALRLLGDLEGARKHLNKALDIAPRDPETLYVAVMLDRDEGLETDKAIEDLDRILKRSESLLRVRYRLALLCALAGRRDESRAQAEKILDFNADHLLAARLIKLLDSGGIEIEKAVAAAPDAATGGDAVQDAVAEAPAVQVAVAPVHPETPRKEGEGAVPAGVPGGKSFDFYLEKAYQLRSQGNCSMAVDYFERALDIKPSSADALSGMGYCHMSMNQLGAAVSAFKQALASNKAYGPALIGIAQAYEKKGSIKAARDYYQEYLDHFATGPQSGLARSKLKELADTIGPEDKPGTGEEEGTPPKVVVPEKEVEVEIKGSVGQPSGDTPKTAGDPYD
jgi:predicted Zn finger-like uncharacterized protein